MNSQSKKSERAGRPGWDRRLRLLRDERGTASTETIMMMPAFLIIWGSVVYVFSLGRSIVEMNVRIREGAWTRAYDGCETTPDSPTRISEGSSGDSSTSDVPLFASMILDTIFTEFHASRNGSVDQPPVLGGDTQSYRGDMIWMCNENPDDYDVANFIASVWGSFGF